MSRVASIVPAETDLLCEGCGYTLNGLPEGSNCPECGRPIVQSIGPQVRLLPLWEQPEAGPPLLRFLQTTAAVLFTPSKFFRRLATRTDNPAAQRFGQIHVAIASLLLGLTAFLHGTWFVGLVDADQISGWQAAVLLMVCVTGTYLFMSLILFVAARLTAWEAAYRGLRLPLNSVGRSLHYHTAHYLPVAIVPLITVIGYQLLLFHNRHDTARYLYWLDRTNIYLYILSAEVIVAAGYLFNTYWIGMRNMMYANR